MSNLEVLPELLEVPTLVPEVSAAQDAQIIPFPNQTPSNTSIELPRLKPEDISEQQHNMLRTMLLQTLKDPTARLAPREIWAPLSGSENAKKLSFNALKKIIGKTTLSQALEYEGNAHTRKYGFAPELLDGSEQAFLEERPEIIYTEREQKIIDYLNENLDIPIPPAKLMDLIEGSKTAKKTVVDRLIVKIKTDPLLKDCLKEKGGGPRRYYWFSLEDNSDPEVEIVYVPREQAIIDDMLKNEGILRRASDINKCIDAPSDTRSHTLKRTIEKIKRDPKLCTRLIKDGKGQKARFGLLPEVLETQETSEKLATKVIEKFDHRSPEVQKELRKKARKENNPVSVLPTAGIKKETLVSLYEIKANGKCNNVDPELFFPSKEDAASLKAARKVCESCVYKEICLETALEIGEKFGIWGGTSERQRRKIRRERRLAAEALAAANS